MPHDILPAETSRRKSDEANNKEPAKFLAECTDIIASATSLGSYICRVSTNSIDDNYIHIVNTKLREMGYIVSWAGGIDFIFISWKEAEYN